MDFLELHNENTRKAMYAHHSTNLWPGTPSDGHPIEMPISATWTEQDAEAAEDGEEAPGHAPW